jgi:hypothetical protein
MFNKITPIFIIYLLSLNLSFMKCVDDTNENEEAQQRKRQRDLDKILYQVYAENDKNEQMLKKQRQRQGDKIEEYRGEHDGKNYEDQSTKNTSRYQQNELIIKILWAPFDKTFKLLPQMNASLGDSRFHLSFGIGQIGGSSLATLIKRICYI